MSATSLTFWLVTITIITAITVYFFVKVVRAKPKPEPDSYAENDDVPR